MKNTDREIIKKLVNDSKNFLVILSQADDDSLASGIMLKRILKSMGKNVKAIHYEPISSKYSYIPYLKEVEVENPANVDYSKYDVGVAVDAGSMKQIVGIEKVDSFKFPKDFNLICVDHHLGNTGFAKYNIYEPTASSATELVYRNFIQSVDDVEPITEYEIKDKDEATLLFTGLTEDTGFFKWSVNKYVFRVCEKLVEAGADTNYVTNSLHYSRDINFYKFLVYSIPKIEFFKDIKFMALFLTSDDIKQMGLNEKQVFSFTRYYHEMFTCSYKGFDYGAVVIQTNTKISGSFRGNSYLNKVNLDLLCKSITKNGGGHFNSAGFDVIGKFSPKDLSEYKMKIIDIVTKMII